MNNSLLEKLIAKQTELLTRIQAIENDFKKGRSQDFAEQATETENDQVLDAIRIEAKNELQQVNASIARIKENQYGICLHCDQNIGQERLNALPYTQTCINCAQ